MTSIIIVTYESEKTIEKLLTSLQKTLTKGAYEVIIVDNNSQDKTLEKVKRFSFVEVVTHNKNTGFAFACHSGAKRAKGEYLLFLNPDIMLKEDILKPVIPLFEDTTIGVVGIKIKNFDSTIQPSIRRFPTLISQLLIALKVPHISKRLPYLRSYYAFDFDYTKESDVDQVMGAVFFTSRTLWDSIGGFDKRFFIWFEEIDYCYQVKKLGYRVLYTPNTFVQHIGGDSFSQVSTLKKQLWFYHLEL